MTTLPTTIKVGDYIWGRGWVVAVTLDDEEGYIIRFQDTDGTVRVVTHREKAQRAEGWGGFSRQHAKVLGSI